MSICFIETVYGCNMILRLILLLFITIAPTGCMKALQADVKSKSDFDLCYHVATKPSYNINYKNAQKEIKDRGISCLKFGYQVSKVRSSNMSYSSAASNICNCKGYSGPGGPCYDGPGGAAYDGPGGPAYSGPGGACYDGPGGACYSGPGGGRMCPAICR